MGLVRRKKVHRSQLVGRQREGEVACARSVLLVGSTRIESVTKAARGCRAVHPAGSGSPTPLFYSLSYASGPESHEDESIGWFATWHGRCGYLSMRDKQSPSKETLRLGLSRTSKSCDRNSLTMHKTATEQPLCCAKATVSHLIPNQIETLKVSVYSRG